MGEIREPVRLVNIGDTLQAPRTRKSRKKPRAVEVDAIVDTGAVMSVIPSHVALKLGIGLRTKRVAKYADGPTEEVGVTNPILWEVQGRDTVEEALVLGDTVLIGQTVLDKLDLLADCAGRRLIPHPDRPDQPVAVVR
ncbi:MAG: aspartyl protease family protein [Phycisphaerae bacterium]|nr:aspartyl protease family protein [Tepidisphaeraceae bacterium]